MALLDVRPGCSVNVRAQRLSLHGCLRPIDLGLLRIAKLDAARLGGDRSRPLRELLGNIRDLSIFPTTSLCFAFDAVQH